MVRTWKKIVALGTLLLFGSLSCAKSTIPPPSPLAEEIRVSFGTIGVRATWRSPEGQFQGTTTTRKIGGGKAALEGAGEGALTWMEMADFHSTDGPADLFVLTALLPVAVMLGALVGLMNAPSVTEVNEAGVTLNNTLEELKIQEALRDRVFSLLQEKTPYHVVLDTSSEAVSGIDTLLDMSVPRVALVGADVESQPLLELRMEARATLRRASDMAELYNRTWAHTGEQKPLTDWLANGAQAFREQIQQGYSSLSEKIVEDLFLRPERAPEEYHDTDSDVEA